MDTGGFMGIFTDATVTGDQGFRPFTGPLFTYEECFELFTGSVVTMTNIWGSLQFLRSRGHG